MNIYFCGSIRGGRQDAALYKRMIEYLKQFGLVVFHILFQSHRAKLVCFGEYYRVSDKQWS